jgi:cytochrome c-type biogenesis protein CcmH/NrfG
MEDLPPADADPVHPAVATLFASVAEAASYVFDRTDDAGAGATASELFARLIAAHPTDGRFLRGAAEHAQRTGDSAAALAAWRGLLSGLPQGSDEWFEAKCRIIEMLVESDVPAARAAMAQHRVLFPDLGREPWRARLLKLEQRLEDSTPEGSP